MKRDFKMKKAINIRDAAVKAEKGLTKKAMVALKKEGFLVFLKKSFLFAGGFSKRFFREYVPLKILYSLSDDGKLVKEIQGSKMVLDLNDQGISRELAVYGCHEKNSTQQTKSILRPGMTVLEVGANIGYYALMEAKIVGNQGKVFAFEPSPYNFNLLQANIELNGYRNIETFPKAIGDKEGRAMFYVAGRSNLSGFIKRDDMASMYRGGKEDVVEVEVVRLDNFLRDKKVDFIRMDVEGFETEILKGMEKTLSSKSAPAYFFIEVHSELLHKKNSSAGALVGYLKHYGYEVEKSFYRGGDKVAAKSTAELVNHPWLERGYWETFFRRI